MNKQGDSRRSRIRLLRRPVPAIFIPGLIVLLLISALGTWALKSHAAGTPPLVSIPDSVPPVVARAQLVGHYSSAASGASNMPMVIGVVLAPNHESQIQALVHNM